MLLRHGGGPAVKHVLRYKASGCLSLERITNNDVVVASYWELMNSCPWPQRVVIEEEKDARSVADDPGPIERAIRACLIDGEGGQLHQINWYRVSIIITEYC